MNLAEDPGHARVLAKLREQCGRRGPASSETTRRPGMPRALLIRADGYVSPGYMSPFVRVNQRPARTCENRLGLSQIARGEPGILALSGSAAVPLFERRFAVYSQPTVFVVDGNACARNAVCDLINRQRQQARLLQEQLRERMAQLSPKEQRVLEGIGEGKSTRAIGSISIGDCRPFDGCAPRFHGRAHALGSEWMPATG